MTTTLLSAGFAPAVTASSAAPDTDGYLGTLNDRPFHIHPTATPDEWAMLEAAIAEGSVTVSAWAAPVVTIAQAMADLRLTRDLLLAKSDWTQMSDNALTTGERADWATYRQTLRDLPSANASDPAAAVFPDTPSS